MSLLQRLGRAWRFGRHIPPAKIARRLALRIQRAARDVGWLKLADLPPPPVVERPPQPLFAPRASALTRTVEGLRFRFLGSEEAMADAIDWGAQPRWQLWRMNLHYMEWLEDQPAEFARAAMVDWIAGNPLECKGCWKDAWNAYALSLRVVVWMQSYARHGLHDETVLRSVYRQLRFLERNLETDLGGNHLVKNIKALIWGAAFFDGPDAARWRALGLKLLDAALREQILADGVHYERSPSYHLQVFADLLECRHALGASTPAALDAALHRMAQASADLVHPDGLVAQFNDSGLHMAYPAAETLAAYALLLGPASSPRENISLPQAGYFGRRRGGDYLLFDAGLLAPDDLPAHGHGDLLSFEWSVEGERFIVDPGVFEYIAGPRRQAARSAASHNTLCFEGYDQAEFFGAFRFGRRPTPEVLRVSFEGETVDIEATFDGFAGPRRSPSPSPRLRGEGRGEGPLVEREGRELQSLPSDKSALQCRAAPHPNPLPASGERGSPRHIRRVTASANELRVADHIKGQPPRPAQIGFLLHPDVTIEIQGDAVALLRGATRVAVSSSAPLAIADSVWWPDMGVEIPTRRLVVSIDPGRTEVLTTFAIVARGRAS